MEPSILVEVRPGWRQLTLNRPARLNAFDAGMHAALRDAIAGAAADPACRAVLLTGAGRGFCAGQDLAEPGLVPEAGAPPPDLGTVLERGWNPLVAAIRALPKPVVAAVHGSAFGAGANLALACDIVLAAENARFAQPFLKLALIPDSGGTWLLPRLAGSARAMGHALLGEPVTGAEAAAWGLIWRALPADRLLPDAAALCDRLAQMPAEALAATKRAFQAAATGTLEEALAREAALQRGLGAAPDYAEGVAAFAGKRPARFA